MRLRPLDIAILAVALLATVFVSAQVYGQGGREVSVRISGRDGSWAFPLKMDREFAVRGPLGSTIVEIRGGRVSIEESPCPNKTCVLAGAIERPGQWVACLPNQVFVKLEGGGRSDELDGATW